MKSTFIYSKTRTTDNVDWASALKNYLGKLYGSFTDFSKETNIINKLRLDLNTNNDDSNKTFLKDLYYKYYGQLELLDLRLPVNELGVRIKFTWYDAYDELTHYTQQSLAFEKASILFNLASILASIAADKFSDGDYKVSYQYFQYSAGVYKFISENFLHAPSQDLDGKTIAFLQNLQLAQAQEVFLLKLLSEDATKYSLIAKLSLAVHNHYEQASTNYEKLDEFQFGEERKWTNNLKFKTGFYYNIALYNHALSIEEKKIGESIAFLKIALGGFESLKKIDNQTGIDFKTYQSQSEDKIKTLTRDNDFIYHDLIPSRDSVDPPAIIKPFDAVKPISLNDHANITEIIGEDIFEKIIPMAVHEKLSLYSEQKAQILRGEIEKNETADIEMTSFLEYLNLPQSLESFKNNSQNKLDPKLISWSNEVNDSNYKDIDANRATINEKKTTVLSTIKELEAKLAEEENDYNQKKAQLGSAQETSYQQSASLRDELTNAKQSILSAAKLDQDLNKSIDPELTRLNQLKSTQQLEAVLFHSDQNTNLLDMDDTATEKVAIHITRIEASLKLLTNLKSERSKIIDDLKNAIHDDDISNILILNNKKLSEKDEKLLFEQELTKFEPYTDRLDSIIFKQPQIIKEVKIAYDEILSSSTNISEKALKLKQYEGTYKAFREYQSNFQKSVTFYDNLVNFVNDVKGNVTQFVNDRYSQRDRLLNNYNSISAQPQPDFLRERFNKLSVGSNQSPRSSYSDIQQQQQQPYRQPSYTGSASSHHSYEQPTPQSSYYQNSPQLPPKPQPQAPSQPQGYQSYQPLQPSQPTPPSYGSSPYGSQPPLPPKQPSQQSFNYPTPPQQPQPPSGFASLQQPQQTNNNGHAFYESPSVYDPSLYKTFGTQQQQAPQPPQPTQSSFQQQQQQPRYSYPHDPNRPYQ